MLRTLYRHGYRYPGETKRCTYCLGVWPASMFSKSQWNVRKTRLRFRKKREPTANDELKAIFAAFDRDGEPFTWRRCKNCTVTNKCALYVQCLAPHASQISTPRRFGKSTRSPSPAALPQPAAAAKPAPRSTSQHGAGGAAARGRSGRFWTSGKEHACTPSEARSGSADACLWLDSRGGRLGDAQPSALPCSWRAWQSAFRYAPRSTSPCAS
jgi:hypothetical protein